MKKLLLASLFFSSAVAAQPTVLMIGTSHDQLGTTGNKTGVWLSELSHAYDEFLKAGIEVEFASISGEGFPLDPNSLANLDNSAKAFLLSDKSRHLISAEKVSSLAEVGAKNYDAVYLIGGHGVMWDFKDNEQLNHIISKTYSENGIVGAVCHGVAGLLTVKDTSGNLLVAEKNVTGFSDEEEEELELTKDVPFLLETKLKQANANYSQSKENFSSYVVVDQRLVTGQNPASATVVATNMIKLLK